VLVEIALGNLQRREDTRRLVGQLPQTTLATPAEILEFSRGTNSTASASEMWTPNSSQATRPTENARTWTRDRRLREAAERVGIAFDDGRSR
jgi:hypothetical protein